MIRKITIAFEAYRSNRFLHIFNFIFILTALVYRTALALGVRASEAAPFGVEKTFSNAVALFLILGNDCIVLIVFNLIWLLLHFAWRFKNEAIVVLKRKHGFFFLLLFAVFVFWNTVITASQYSSVFTMNSGFTYALFMELFSILGLHNFVTLLPVTDFLLLLTPVLIYFALSLRKHWRVSRKYIATVLIAAAAVLILRPLFTMQYIPDELRLNPHEYFMRDILRTLLRKKDTNKRDALSTANVYLDDPLFAKNNIDNGEGLYRSREYPNFVFIVLESTGSEYIFDTEKYAEGKMPMPYLYSLTKKSLYMSQHFASNNSSPRSIFSIFSGLYESPQTAFFSMKENLKVPHLINFLGSRYDAFLVTPADINWYFPKAWFKNRGFTRIYDYNTMKNVPEYKAGPTPVRDEFKSVDYFLSLIRESQKPFLGIYYTFVGHWPYPDLTEEHKIVKSNSSRHRYINNLFAQDQVIEKIIATLKETDKFNNTIFIIVGDHGEAFYQHPGNRVHSGESYNENIASPLVMYSPRYMISYKVKYPTTHADIVPTLLEVSGIPYKKEQFQGESLNTKRVRRYVFTYGNENTLTAVSNDFIKMQILRKDEGGCRSFDLKNDWAETKNLGCNINAPQYKAIEAFFRKQPDILKGYNDLCNKSGC
ncbi:MAG TPA: LTA synthase family protein [Turneriella sp.]|nr:LTA synthase family protein [Turneriella sp.]